MDSNSFVQWLKQEGLFPIVEKYYACFKKVFHDCLKVDKEQVMIIYDEGYPMRRCSALMAGCYVLAAKRLNIAYKLVKQEPKNTGDTANDLVIESLFQFPEKNVLVLCLSGKLGSMKQFGKSWRSYVSSNKHRFVSATGLRDLDTKYFRDLVKSVDLDYQTMQKRAKALKQKIDYANECRILTDKGTNLYVNIQGKQSIANDAEYSKIGGNIPAGEVYFAPRGKRVEGTIVIDGTIRHAEGTLLVKKPVILKVENGEIIDIKGEDEAKILEQSFEKYINQAKYPWGIKRIGEIGIGISEGASLIPVTIVSEKVLGTAHVGIGSNAWFGGTIYAISHMDQVFKNPRIYLDNKKIDI
ncbi:MAG: aminopeptidase [Candidatus Woesearchaeota archaeon]|jgi:hypothetical protein|nr:aminopeptidase [Candidatus Woesearchaeota archaeon]MDP7458588.1 aminopeptidase [Candidatus Woesearchaeota archaeon]